MAQLSSPGVSVSVINESFYTTAAPGTVPVIFVATAENKLNSSGTGIAPGTLKTNAGKVYLLTSQKDLSDTFGTPIFKTDANSNPVHAGEQNEYGLQAAYSYLGVSNRAYVVRADVDLAQLKPAAVQPVSAPADGTYWFDTTSTHWGLFTWNSDLATVPGGQTFTNVVPMVITDPMEVVEFGADNTPKPSIGAIGDYAIVSVTNLVTVWYKRPINPAWVLVGSEDWVASIPAVKAPTTSALLSGDVLTINGTAITGVQSIAELVTLINLNADLITLGITAAEVNTKLQLFSTGVDIELESNAGSTALKLGLTTSTSAYSATFKAPTLQISAHTAVPAYKRVDDPLTENNRPTGSLWIKTTNSNKGADWVVKKYSAASASWTDIKAPIYENHTTALAKLDPAHGGINLATNTLYVKYNETEEMTAADSPYATFKLYRRVAATETKIVSASLNYNTFTSESSYTFNIEESVLGSTEFSAPVAITFTTPVAAASGATPAETTANQLAKAREVAEVIVSAINNTLPAGSSVRADVNSSRQIVIRHTKGGEIKFTELVSGPISVLFDFNTVDNFYLHPVAGGNDFYIASLWSEYKADGYTAFAIPSATVPTTSAADSILWYDININDVDIMVHDGNTWRGYRNVDVGAGIGKTDAGGPFVTPTEPTAQRDNSMLEHGDLWINTGDTEIFPQIYKYDSGTKSWQLMDVTDQESENGILFADARWNTDGSSKESTIVELLGGTSVELSEDLRAGADFLDFDAPDPALYPKGMLLWNLRRSGFNVKRLHKNYVNTLARNLRFNNEVMETYYPHRWVSAAANQENGVGSFGRKAQRRVVIQALQATVNGNQDIRDEESRSFNLIATPGYPELTNEMVNLNYDRGITAFVVADTPARLPADATSLSNWGMNVAGAVEDNDDGLVTSDEYVGFFYPWGYSSDNLGNNIVVPPSHMMLRTIALSDNVSFPWFAPAGTSRGGITNASSVGYVTSGGEFRTVALNNGQRDTLASIKVNPLSYITGVGLVNFGQYTRAKEASSLDRINVARLVAYLRRRFAQLAKPYLFEQNDLETRNQIKYAADSMLLELSGQRAIYDYIVVCDETNNTPARIDRGEIYLDVAIEPTKAVEFIYIPLRLKNTGEIKGLG